VLLLPLLVPLLLPPLLVPLLLPLLVPLLLPLLLPPLLVLPDQPLLAPPDTGGALRKQQTGALAGPPHRRLL
jgi:hypothetical protein